MNHFGRYLTNRARSALAVAALLVVAASAPAAPLVDFRWDDESARQAAERCAEVWRTESADLCAAAGFTAAFEGAADTITCLVLGTGNFGRSFGNLIPDWGVGVALPGGRVVALDHSRLPAVGRGLREVFLHEMTHALLFRAAGPTPLPAWLHEGLAMRLSGEWRFTDTVSLALEGKVPDLGDLRGPFPGSAHRASRAYLTSELAVDRLLDQHGSGIVMQLTSAARRTGDFRLAFEEVTGEPLEVFEGRFADAMRIRFGWLVMLTRWPALFVVLAVVLAVTAVARLISNRRRLAAMPDDDWPENIPS